MYYLVSYALSYVLIMTSQIWKFKGWLKIQTREYLESGTEFFYKTKEFITCASLSTF